MNYFLERIARHLLDGYSDRLEKQCVVFPGRRAGLYFRKNLAANAGRPLWSPAVTTINELISSTSSLKIAGSEILVSELYKEYRKLSPEAESFDEFYFWGEMIINDFDDIDKYLADAKRLFTNLSDLKEIDSQFGGLSQEQADAVRRFWVSFSAGGNTREKSDFLSIWSVLPELYISFRQSLADKGLAYEGMICRDLAEKCRRDDLPQFRWETFHFVGFNALNQSEHVFLKALQRAGMAKFYWDYDQSYVQQGSDHSAGYFIRNNLKEFGNDMPSDWSYSTYVSTEPGNVERRIIETPSDMAQVKLIPELLNEFNEVDGEDGRHTAIVLADETLLVPLLSSIPEDIPDVNITMGYPLRFSPVYSLVKNLLLLQAVSRKEDEMVLFDHSAVFNIINHNFFSAEDIPDSRQLVSELLAENRQWIPSGRFSGIRPFDHIFSRIDDPARLPSYLRKVLETVYISDEVPQGNLQMDRLSRMIHNEFVHRTLLAINRLEYIINESGIKAGMGIWSRILDKILRAVSIPFAGEPLKGIQVMGILETRALDFRNIIMLSANEGTLPKSSAGSSYIPYNLREAFGLPALRHQDSIYSYYFYRLLHKAEKVTFVYNSSADGLKTGEMSRFLQQLSYLGKKPPAISGKSFSIVTVKKIPEALDRIDRHQLILEEMFTGPARKPLSPSAVNTWLSCRMRFYYKYICSISEPEKIKTAMDPAIFGSLLHRIMERIYKPYTGKDVDKQTLRRIIENTGETVRITEESINEIFYGGGETYGTRREQVTAGILSSYAGLILKRDYAYAPFIQDGLEKSVRSVISISLDGKDHEILIGGIIDRLDRKEGILRILDYKTGNVSMEAESVESLFEESDEKRNEAWFQILMYCEISAGSGEGNSICPSIYSMRGLSDPDYSEMLTIGSDRKTSFTLESYNRIREEFSERLSSVIRSVFSRENPFMMTEDMRKCDYCPYRALCRR